MCPSNVIASMAAKPDSASPDRLSSASTSAFNCTVYGMVGTRTVIHSAWDPRVVAPPDERVGVAERPVDDRIVGIERQAALVEIESLGRTSGEPVRRIQDHAAERREGIGLEETARDVDSGLHLPRRLEGNALKEPRVGVRPVALKGLRHVAHGVGQLAALVGDESEE